jgi:hypothetical protein
MSGAETRRPLRRLHEQALSGMSKRRSTVTNERTSLIPAICKSLSPFRRPRSDLSPLMPREWTMRDLTHWDRRLVASGPFVMRHLRSPGQLLTIPGVNL